MNFDWLWMPLIPRTIREQTLEMFWWDGLLKGAVLGSFATALVFGLLLLVLVLFLRRRR